MDVNHTILVDTRWKQRFRLAKEDDSNTDYENNGVSVSDFFRFTENVNYTMKKVDTTLEIEYLSGQSDHFSPIWSVILFLVGFQMISSGKLFNLGPCNIFLIGWNYGIDSYLKKKSGSVANPNYAETSNVQNRSRLQSLDTFRGICITIMIFVNYGGKGSS